MPQFRSFSPLRIALSSAALTAAFTFALAPARTEAGGELRRHSARTAQVDIDAQLTRGEREGAQGWAIAVKAANASAAQRCSVRVSLTRLPPGSQFSRVAPMPKTVWSTLVAMEVPAKGQAEKAVALPANVARQVEAASRQEDAEAAPVFGASTSASCSPSSDSIS